MRTGPLVGLTTLVAAPLLLATPATAGSPARERELSCSDGTVFVGEQVRMGAGHPARAWRNVDPGGTPAAFTIPVGPLAGHTAEFTGFFVP
jgi:hypothetical protein